jgi:hypothetical protein
MPLRSGSRIVHMQGVQQRQCGEARMSVPRLDAIQDPPADFFNSSVRSHDVSLRLWHCCYARLAPSSTGCFEYWHIARAVRSQCRLVSANKNSEYKRIDMQSRKREASASQEHPDVAPTERGARGVEPEPPRWVGKPETLQSFRSGWSRGGLSRRACARPGVEGPHHFMEGPTHERALRWTP